MNTTIVIGSQWGDEGKGKIIDFLSEKADYVIRFHGGNNAGHTVINSFGKFPMHLIPSGIFSKKAVGCITNGTVIDLEVLVAEIAMLEKAGIQLKDKLFISPRCHLIMPYHKILDRLYEAAKGKAATGTTGRGIGPVYADKVSYNGIRIFDLLSKKQFSEKLAIQLSVKNKIIKALGEMTLQQKDIEKTYFKLIKKIMPYVKEPYPLLQKALEKKKNLLFEGAHGVFLDNDWGTYPFVTASTVLSGGITGGSGIPAQKLTDVIGVVKAYTTRVGAGPFPTELFDEDGELLRKEGAEFGTTTGRPRRCGWFDAELIRFAAQSSGYTGVAVTKLDVLDSFEKIKICTGYTLNGKKVGYAEMDAVMLGRAKPVYKTLKGWQTPTKGITSFEKLPEKAKAYVKELEKQIGTKVSYISTGPKREEIIVR
ncbi:MAG TPA: adenylosuccinate synthase [Candidatus Saccharimonadales bacterium]|nr:adenylosuccinate synthase [Candidatus Saccharimonadales bacterium]